jgi:pimeloyl-ACP methyl ester carboxylesterase
VPDVDLYYEVHGSGPPLVLLHGAMGTIESCFADLLPRLAADHQVIAVELQGHGHTPDNERPLTYEAMADDIAGLLGELGIDRADLVGYSMGGGVALQVAVRHPDHVRRLVFFGGAAFSPGGLYPEVQADFDADPPIAELEASRWHEAYVRVAPDPKAWPALVTKVNELDSAWTGFPPEQLRAITAPTLLIIGDADIVRPEHAVEMFGLLGGGVPGDLVPLPPAQLAVLPGTNHVGMLEHTDWLHSMISRFLTRP